MSDYYKARQLWANPIEFYKIHMQGQVGGRDISGAKVA